MDLDRLIRQNGSTLTRSNGRLFDLDVRSYQGAYEFETVERRVEISTEGWARDLRSLFEHAKERFGDVSWESEEGGDRVWGHKAVIYARAPKAFKDRYFISKPFSRSPTALSSPQPHFLPSLYPTRPNSPPSSYPRLSPLPGRQSSLSVDTYLSEGTIRAPIDPVLRLTHGDTPEMFQAQLEWLYTGEGFGDVVEWISAEDDLGLGESIRDSLGRRGDIHERRDKLGQDLTYMWRSKLYADVKIHLDNPSTDNDVSDDSDESTDSLSSTASFTAHKFVLVSRSPYFASLLLNHSSFQSHSLDDIHLPTPPFTPAALHFCLGWMYAGHLDFSNRSFDLTTAFQIHRAATYLQLDALVGEVEARIVWDFCHGLNRSKCSCKRCPFRAARVWRFASSSDVGAIGLVTLARRYLVEAWADSWGRDVATADEAQRNDLVRDVVGTFQAGNVVATIRSIAMVKTRMETALRTKGREASAWVATLESMVEEIQLAVRSVLVEQFAQVAQGAELWDVLYGKGFNTDFLDDIGRELLEAISTSKGCTEAPRVYQILVSSILLKVDPITQEMVLPGRGRSRQQIEVIKDGVIGHIRRRWMQVRDAGGFDGVENWALKEISDEIEVSVEDLLAALPSTPTKSRISAAPSKPSPKPAVPKHPTRVAAGSTSGAGASKVASSARPPDRSRTPPDATGLKRLRLSSSASANSVASSSRSALRPKQPQPASNAPRARSPTAARQSSTVSIGPSRRPRPTGTSSPTPSAKTTKTIQTLTPRSMSGPPRPLLTQPSKPTRPIPEAPIRSGKSSPSPSLTSVKTTRTARSVAPPASSTINKASPKPSLPTTASTSSSAGPSRLRTASASTTASVRKPVGPRVEPPVPKPPVPSARTVSTGMTSVRERVNRLEAPVPPDTRSRTVSSSTTTSVRSRVSTLGGKTPTGTKPPPLPASSTTLTKETPGASSTAASSAASKAPSIAPSIRNRTASAMSTAPSVASRAATTTKPVPKTPSTPSRNAAVISSSTSTSKASPSSKPTSPAKSVVSTTRTRAASSKLASAITAVPAPVKTRIGGRSLAFPQNPPVSAVPPLARTKQSVRSPSSSTDDTNEARTPSGSHLLSHPEPTILREGSDGSDLALPRLTAPSPTKLPPVSIAMPRPTRKVSTSSTRSNTSSMSRLHPHHPASAFDPPRRVEVQTPLPKESFTLPPDVERFKGKGVELNIGVPCIVSLASKRARFKAAIKYIGHLANSRGAWVGLEVDDLDRLGIDTLASGAQDGIHYFHLSPPLDDEQDEARLARQRKVEIIRDSLRKRHFGNGGLTVSEAMIHGGSKRSASPFVDFAHAGFENPRALFVRPTEIVYVLGAE